jgi:DNA-binding LytR/AlgR family response regulator
LWLYGYFGRVGMFRVGICDDEKNCRDHLNRLCHVFFKRAAQEYECIEFNSAEELLDYEGEKLTILFLDIEMGELSGIDALKRIKEKKLAWRVVFVSNHMDLRYSTMDITVLAFIDKPVAYLPVSKCLEVAIKENKENLTIRFNAMQGYAFFQIEDIVSIKADGHYTILLTKDKKEITLNDSITRCEELLKGLQIIRVHKSYMINAAYIKDWSSNGIVTEDGRVYPLGRKYSKESRKAYDDYVRELIKERNVGE